MKMKSKGCCLLLSSLSVFALISGLYRAATFLSFLSDSYHHDDHYNHATARRDGHAGGRSADEADRTSSNGGSGPIHVLITVCNGERVNFERKAMARYREAADLLVTVQRYGTGSDDERIIAHVFADNADVLKEEFIEKPPISISTGRLDVRVRRMPEPGDGGRDYDRYRACASSRLYAPHLFEASARNANKNATDSGEGLDGMPRRVLYLDTDTLVTAPLRGLWDLSNSAFDAKRDALFAMSPTCELTEEMGPYYHTGYLGENVTGPDGKVRHIYKIPNGTCAGYNSGVLFADLKRWKEVDFASMVDEQESYAKEVGLEMPFGDNGILNAMSARYPERHVALPCRWNLRIESLSGCYDEYVRGGGGVLHVQYKNRMKFREGGSVSKSLREYVVRAEGAAGELRDYLPEDYDRKNDDNVMFADILEQMIRNDTAKLG